MLHLTPLPPDQFDLLIGRTKTNRKVMKQRGQLQPLIVASPQQRADGLWREQIFIAADAVILTAIDMLVEAGAPRAAIDQVMSEIQLEIVSRLNALDNGAHIFLAFAHDGARWVVVSAATGVETMKEVAAHFATGAGTEPPKIFFYCVPLHEAVATVRARAAEHDIELPERIWPTPEELDAGADLLAAAIAPRTSPVIQQWQALREREASPVVCVQ